MTPSPANRLKFHPKLPSTRFNLSITIAFAAVPLSGPA